MIFGRGTKRKRNVSQVESFAFLAEAIILQAKEDSLLSEETLKKRNKKKDAINFLKSEWADSLISFCLEYAEIKGARHEKTISVC